MPRYYTIASSSIVHPTAVRIAISLSTYDTPIEKGRLGLVSQWCINLQKNPQLQTKLFAKDSNFILNNKKPLFMVGPGTGVVPFIAFCEEREYESEAKKQTIVNGHLFFGCRDKKLKAHPRKFKKYGSCVSRNFG